jgi:hypothetical protein
LSFKGLSQKNNNNNPSRAIRRTPNDSGRQTRPEGDYAQIEKKLARIEKEQQEELWRRYEQQLNNLYASAHSVT